MVVTSIVRPASCNTMGLLVSAGLNVIHRSGCPIFIMREIAIILVNLLLNMVHAAPACTDSMDDNSARTAGRSDSTDQEPVPCSNSLAAAAMSSGVMLASVSAALEDIPPLIFQRALFIASLLSMRAHTQNKNVLSFLKRPSRLRNKI